MKTFTRFRVVTDRIIFSLGGRAIMDGRFLAKSLWAAAVVLVVVGAFGRGVLAEKPAPPRCSSR